MFIPDGGEIVRSKEVPGPFSLSDPTPTQIVLDCSYPRAPLSKYRAQDPQLLAGKRLYIVSPVSSFGAIRVMISPLEVRKVLRPWHLLVECCGDRAQSGEDLDQHIDADEDVDTERSPRSEKCV